MVWWVPHREKNIHTPEQTRVPVLGRLGQLLHLDVFAYMDLPDTMRRCHCQKGNTMMLANGYRSQVVVVEGDSLSHCSRCCGLGGALHLAQPRFLRVEGRLPGGGHSVGHRRLHGGPKERNIWVNPNDE